MVTEGETVAFGDPPWDRDALVDLLEEFEALYQNRPIQDNAGGMGAPHLFATWAIAKTLKPDLIVESGVWFGQSTWILELACPNAQIHALDLNLDKRRFISDRVHYHAQDFTALDWTQAHQARSLVLFDDHQNAYNRLIHASWFGFDHVIFEDNYPPGSGDFYSLKMAFAGSGFGEVGAESASDEYKRLWSRASRAALAMANRRTGGDSTVIPQYQRALVVPNQFDAQMLRHRLGCYAEFPPVFDPGHGPTPSPLVGDAEAERYRALYGERARYNWLCYAELV